MWGEIREAGMITSYTTTMPPMSYRHVHLLDSSVAPSGSSDHAGIISLSIHPCSMSRSTSVIFIGLTGRSAVSVNPMVTVLNLLSLSTPLSLLKENKTQSALPAGMAGIIIHLYNMVRLRGCDEGTQTEVEGKEDKTTQNEVGIRVSYQVFDCV